MTLVEDALRNAVLQRLELLDKVAEHGAAETLVPLARAEIHRLADGWRLLLTVHQPDEDGRCRACPGWLRRRRWPCQVWTMAHQHLIGEGVPHRERRRPLRNPFTRVGIVEEPPGAEEITMVPEEVEDGTELTTEFPIISEEAEPVHRAPVVTRPRHALPD